MSFLDPQFRVTRARSCIYLLLSKFFSREFRGSEVDLSLALIRDSAEALPDYFWKDKFARTDFYELLRQAECVRNEVPAFLLLELSEASTQFEIKPISSDSNSGEPSATRPSNGTNGQHKLSPFDKARITSAFDLLALELGHLHLLTKAESEYIDENKAEAVNKSHYEQVAFLWEHLRKSMTVFKNLSESCPWELYRHLIKITHLFTEADSIYACFLLGRTTDLRTALEATGLSALKKA